MRLDVEKYIYYQNYLKQLTIYYNENVIAMSISNRCSVCREIEGLENMLNFTNKNIA